MEDKRIIELFRRRDEQAIAEARNKYGGYCHKIAYNLLSVHEDAEECVSDALFAAWRQIPPVFPKSLRTFLGRITRNLSISRYRASAAKKRSPNMGPGMEQLLTELEDCLPDGNDLDAQVDSQALAALISRWVDGLTPRDRELFVRRYWYGDSLGEIARAMEETPRELAQRTFRLRKMLKNLLEKEGYSI